MLPGDNDRHRAIGCPGRNLVVAAGDEPCGKAAIAGSEDRRIAAGTEAKALHRASGRVHERRWRRRPQVLDRIHHYRQRQRLEWQLTQSFLDAC
jgi:hypothetical protein